VYPYHRFNPKDPLAIGILIAMGVFGFVLLGIAALFPL
jgi:hypothetical protein